MDVAATSMTCTQLSSLVKVPLSVKAIVPERTLDVISTLEDVRAKRVGLRVSFAAPSHGSVIFHSVWSTALLILSALSATCVG